MTAAAISLLQQEAMTAALTGASDALHRVAKPLDVVPLNPKSGTGELSHILEETRPSALLTDAQLTRHS